MLGWGEGPVGLGKQYIIRDDERDKEANQILTHTEKIEK